MKMKCFRLEDPLQRRKENDQQLAAQGKGHSSNEKSISCQTDRENGFILWSAAQGIEQVKEDETRKSHCSITSKSKEKFNK